MNAPSPGKRVIAVSGTSRGLGRGIATHFAERGWQVCGCSRSEADLGVAGYTHAVVDATDEAQVRRWVRGIKQQHGRIDAVICNVGLVKSALLLPVLPTDLFQQFFDTSLKATFLLCREVAKVMMLQRAGRIVTIGSTMTVVHEPGTAAYAANKAAIVEMTKVMARELAPQGITCNVVSPSMIVTEASEAMGEDWRKRILDLQTIKRPVEIAEVCAVIDFFLAPESGCITGQVVHTCMVD
jgi:3-oxoacyl-[acyl-carrier protein] reductase